MLWEGLPRGASFLLRDGMAATPPHATRLNGTRTIKFLDRGVGALTASPQAKHTALKCSQPGNET